MPHPDMSARAAAMRAADLLAVLEPFAASADHRGVTDVLRRYGEPEPITLTPAGLQGLAKAARALMAVFRAASAEEAAGHLNAILATYAGAPRLSGHDGTPWHLHVDRGDESPWEEWFASSSALALATLLAERQARPSPSGCGHRSPAPLRVSPTTTCSPRSAAWGSARVVSRRPSPSRDRRD